VGTVTSAQVDSVVSLSPGTPAQVGVSLTGGTLHLTFGIPVGVDGLAGPQGPPFGGALVDGVTTVDPFSAASVTSFFDGANVHFSFQIPRGFTGEVSNAGLTAAINDVLINSSNTTNAVATLEPAMADPDNEALRQKLNELILALRR
jgi:hypothetical protein